MPDAEGTPTWQEMYEQAVSRVAALRAELERLTKRNRALEAEAGEAAECRAEIADIQREKLEREKRSRVMDANEARSREQELRAEVERLRAALYRIADPLTIWPVATDRGNPWQAAARAALSPENTNARR